MYAMLGQFGAAQFGTADGPFTPRKFRAVIEQKIASLFFLQPYYCVCTLSLHHSYFGGANFMLSIQFIILRTIFAKFVSLDSA